MQINNTQNLKTISLETDPTSKSLSTLNIYQFLFGSRSSCTDGSSRCEISTDLQYFATGSCDFTFVCSVLDGNPCGSYGIKVGLANEEEDHDVCNVGQTVNGTLTSGQTLEVSLWYTEHMTAQDPKCYLWCRDPLERNKTEKNSNSIDEDTLKDLVG